jgi:hypothetical protein
MFQWREGLVDTLKRIFGAFLLTVGLTFGAIGVAHANGWGSWGHDPSAPELDPSILGSGITILAGGLILLNERGRNRK